MFEYEEKLQRNHGFCSFALWLSTSSIAIDDKIRKELLF